MQIEGPTAVAGIVQNTYPHWIADRVRDRQAAAQRKSFRNGAGGSRTTVSM
jgi:hypothetical protein